MKPNKELYHIINNLQRKGIIFFDEIGISRINGTTDGRVYILSDHNNPKYVLKLDHPQQNDFVKQFLNTYSKVNLFPVLLYADPEMKFIVYSYIEGVTHNHRGLKGDWMDTLVKEVLNKYQKYEQVEKWGRLGIPRESWEEFNRYSVERAYKNLGGLLSNEDYGKVKIMVEHISKSEKQEVKYLLHGDTGVHNFVFKDSKLNGIIDPSPMAGPIIYDFTYAFCSSPDDLNIETLFTAYSALNHTPIDESRLIKEVIIQLYTRMGICVKVHPHDLDDYLKAWEYWRNRFHT